MVWWKKTKTTESHEGSEAPETAVEDADNVQVEDVEESSPVEDAAPAEAEMAVDGPEEPSQTENEESAEELAETDEEPVDESADTEVADESADTEVASDDAQTQLLDAAEIPVESTIEQPTLNEAPAFTAPFSVDVTPVSNSAGMPLTSVPAKTHKVRNTLLTVAGSVLGAAVLVAGCGAIGNSYFDSHAKPGTELAGHDLTGFSMTQVRNVAATVIENYKASLELGGKRVEATQKDLGITFDLDKTVGGAMNAGSAAALSDRYNPFNTKHTILVMSVDEDKLLTYLNQTFIEGQERSTSADVVFDADQGGFTVQPGKNGIEADAAKVAEELKAGQGVSEALTVATIEELPRITNDSAQQTADAANQLLTTDYTVTAASMSYTIPAANIASWVRFTPDEDAGTISMGIDSDKATADIPALLADNLSSPVVAQENLYSPDGRNLGVQTKGSAGTEVADPAAVTAQIVQALTDGSGMNASVDTKATPFPEKQVTIGDGVRWVEVNRSNFTVTRWEGGTQLSTWSVVIGKPSTPTWPGIFHVQSKVRSQTMSGEGYVQPNVEWVAYFNGDIALHGNYWVSSFGWGSSHGCVGMPNAQAEVMYNWIEIGTLVVVHD